MEFLQKSITIRDFATTAEKEVYLIGISDAYPCFEAVVFDSDSMEKVGI